VYCSATESKASIGASLRAGLDRQVVGISNRTQFLRVVSTGTFTIAACGAPERGFARSTTTPEPSRTLSRSDTADAHAAVTCVLCDTAAEVDRCSRQLQPRDGNRRGRDALMAA
jgi:hypothetical protein